MPQTAKTKKALAKSAAAYTAAHTPTKKKTTTKTVGTKTTVTSPTGKTYEFDSKTYKGTDLTGAIKAAEAGTYGTTYTGSPINETPSPEYTQFAEGTTFNSGNPERDKFMNEVWIPLIEAQFSDNPAAIFDDAAFKTYKDQVDKTWGKIFETELSSAQESYDRNIAGIKAEAGYQAEQLGQVEARTLQDTRIGKQRIARNLDEAKMESSMAMANRGLTFGGARRKEETKLTAQAGENVSDLEKESKRTLEDILGKKSYLGLEGNGLKAGVGEYGRQLQEKNVDLEAEKRRLEGEKQLQYESELNRLRNLGSSLLSQQYNQ